MLLMEGGVAWLPGILWRLDTNWRALRSDTPWLERKPSEVVREHVRFTTQPLEHTDGRDDLLFEMLEAAGAPDTLCFASDYPHWDFDDPGFMLKRLPEAWRDRVLHENAAAFYGERLGLVAA
jgi:predicted TIM-barrel fold metal-dependent hydrolase